MRSFKKKRRKTTAPSIFLAVFFTLGGGAGAEVIDPDMPFQCLSMDFRQFGEAPKADNLVPRGIVLPLGSDVYACFDTDLLRVAAVWQAEPGKPPIDYRSVATFSYENTKKKAPGGQEAVSKPLGREILATGLYPGLQVAHAEFFTDPRLRGPEPKEIGRGPYGTFLGVIDHGAGEAPTLRYGINGAILRERLRWDDGVLIRSFEWEKDADRISIVLLEDAEMTRSLARPEAGGSVVAKGAEVGLGRAITLRPVKGAPFQVAIGFGEERDRTVLEGMLAGISPGVTRVPRWPELRETEILPGETGGAPYVSDLIELPDIERKIRPAGIAFRGPGEAVIATIDGDVWTVSGLTADSAQATWRRIGAGLHEPLSVQVVDGSIHVFSRAGIQKLITGSDGEVSEYVTVCDDFTQSADTRDFPLSFASDGAGGFYFSKGGQQMPYRTSHGGRVLHAGRDGTASVFATGLRNAILCRNPETGLITASDQQGHWVPATPVHVIEKGGYYGFKRGAPDGDDVPGEPPVHPPLAWIPHIRSQSGMGQVWTAQDGFGPLGGSLLLLDYFRPGLLQVDVETGAVLPLRIPIPMPLIKAAVNPADGMPYFAGFQIWGTASKTLAGLSRLRFTGAPALHPARVVHGRQGIVLRFNEAPDADIATRPGTWDVQCWNYRRSASYGSGHFKSNGKPGQDYLAVRSAHLSEDGRAVFLDVPGMSEAMQMQVAWKPLSEKLSALADMACFTVADLADLNLAGEGFAPIDFAELAKIVAPTGSGGTASEVSAERGEHVYGLYGCLACHSVDGTTEGKSGPTWKNLYLSEREFRDGSKATADDAYLRESILDPAKRVVTGYDPKDVGMPSYAGILPETDVDSLLLFLKSLADAPQTEIVE